MEAESALAEKEVTQIQIFAEPEIKPRTGWKAAEILSCNCTNNTTPYLYL